MHPIDACIQNPVKVIVGVLLVVLFGVVALFRMPMQLTPEVETPTVTVSTRWPGANPEEVERLIVSEQEEFLKSVTGVQKMSSASQDALGEVTLEFAVGADMEEALVLVNNALAQVPNYPENVDQPVIRAASSADNPIAWFILSPQVPTNEELEKFAESHPEVADELETVIASHNPGLAMLRLRRLVKQRPEVDFGDIAPSDLDMALMRTFAEDEIEPRFERVSGVSNSNVFGGRDEQMEVIFDSHLLAARGVTIADLRDALRDQNRDTSGGEIWEGKRRYVLRTVGRFNSPEDISDLLLKVQDGQPVYVRDVAEVRLGYAKPDGVVRRYGNTAIAINVQRETGANVLEVMSGLQAALNELNNSEPLQRRGLVLTQVYDETEYIDSAVGLVNQNIILGGALTVIVLLSFLHLGGRTLVIAPIILATALLATFLSPWFFLITLALILGVGFWYARGAIVVGLAIPICIVGTFLVLNALGRSLNVISLAGLAFAVGMLVDNAVVVLESIYSEYQKGAKPQVAAAKASKQVWGAVLASTITTLAVFLPVVFIQEEAGQLFRDIALAISAAVSLSLLVSVTFIPMASARILSGTKLDNGEKSVLAAPLLGFGGWIVDRIVGLNQWLLTGVVRRVVVVVLLMGGSLLLSYLLWPKVDYLPNGNRNLIICLVLPPPGYNLDKLKDMGGMVERRLQPYWDIDPDSPEADALDYPPIGDFFYVVRGRQVFIGLRSTEPTRAPELIGLIQREFLGSPELPGAFVVAFQSSLFSRGLQGGRTIDVEITGRDLTQLVQTGGAFLGGVRQRIPNAQVQPIPSLDLASPQLRITRKPDQAAAVGITPTDLGYTVDALVDGAFATEYYRGSDKIDLVIMGADRNVRRTQDVEQQPIATNDGQVVPISSIADVVITSGPEQVNHREKERAITIQVTPPPEMALEEAVQIIENEIVGPARGTELLPPGYNVNISGAADKLEQTWLAMRWNMLLALLITYLLMAALFESWVYPLVVLVSVPLGAVGGIIGLRLLTVYQNGLAAAQGIAPPPPQSLDVLTMLGFVILIGTVVNNAILIVYESLYHMNEDEMESNDAIAQSIRTRIRPIFMTTATTLFGLAPLVLFPGAGSELYRGLGSVVLGGLLVSTVFTLVLVPCLFSLMLDLNTAISRMLGDVEEAPEPAIIVTPSPRLDSSQNESIHEDEYLAPEFVFDDDDSQPSLDLPDDP